MKRALVVGLDDYPEGNELAGCVNDARSIADAIGTNEDGSRNYDVRRLLSEPDRQVTRQELRNGLSELFDAHHDDEVLLFFSGHGRQTEWGAELVTTDLDGVSMEDLLTIAIQSRACQVVVVLDCCFAGAAGDVPALSLTQGITVLREGVVILAAARSDQTAAERGGQGLFTRLLVEGLQGAAADHLGNVSALSLYDFAARAFGGWDQHPVLKGHLSTPCVLRRTRPPLDTTLLRRLPQMFPAAGSRVRLSPDHEGDRTTNAALTAEQQQFEDFKRLRNAGLLLTEDDRDLYYVAMESRTVRLSAMGAAFWRLANDGRL